MEVEGKAEGSIATVDEVVEGVAAAAIVEEGGKKEINLKSEGFRTEGEIPPEPCDPHYFWKHR